MIYKVECYICKSTPTTTPIGKLCNYYVTGLVCICENCLEKMLEESWEHQDDEHINITG